MTNKPIKARGRMANKELKQYQKMLLLLLELNQDSNGVVKVPLLTFLKGFNKYWNKYYPK